MTKSVRKLMLAQRMRRSSTSSTGWTPPGQVCVNVYIIELKRTASFNYEAKIKISK